MTGGLPTLTCCRCLCRLRAEGMGYDSFVCVESGSVVKPITLKPGEEWVGEMRIVASPMV